LVSLPQDLGRFDTIYVYSKMLIFKNKFKEKKLSRKFSESLGIFYLSK
jgi:hypothetical protein